MESRNRSPASAQLCLNYSSPLVRQLAGMGSNDGVRRCLEILYVQALLLAQQPLTTKELAVLSGGILGLVEWAVAKE
jgi:molecular chaperone HtpG